jgi:23S rRNA (cytidine1920-2'-O)/16S rRNA (cytidine1409-2'-O)-methyltransferase
VLREVLGEARDMGYEICGLSESPLRGPKGNVEFLAWLRLPAKPVKGNIEDFLQNLREENSMQQQEEHDA